MRVPRTSATTRLNAALLAYASDYFLMDMVFRIHPDVFGPGTATGFSLDHAIWFHRPVRFDGWHLHTQETVHSSAIAALRRGDPRRAGDSCPPSRKRSSCVRIGLMNRSAKPFFEQPWPEGECRFFQLGLVVDDLFAAAASWVEVFGVGPFHVLPVSEQR